MVGMGLERYHPNGAGGTCWPVGMPSQMHTYCCRSPGVTPPRGGAFVSVGVLGCVLG